MRKEVCILESVAPFFISAGVITLAEMADKTQILSMCFTARYSPRKVMLGVFLGTVLNQGLAVAAGYFLKEILSTYIDIVKIIASLSFIGFGIWTLQSDSEKEKCDAKSSFGPVATVTIAFFLAEMGDKTQLAAVSLSAGLPNPVLVLLGTTTGMLIANGVGVAFGSTLNKKIPDHVVKILSAMAFTMFGIFSYVGTARHLMDFSKVLLSTAVILFATVLIFVLILNRNNKSWRNV